MFLSQIILQNDSEDVEVGSDNENNESIHGEHYWHIAIPNFDLESIGIDNIDNTPVCGEKQKINFIQS